MNSSFHAANREALYNSLSDGTLLLSFAGEAPRLSADAYYPFFANRNFVYLTGLGGTESQGFILLAKKENGTVEETIFALPPDTLAERWNGRRLRYDEISELSGISNILPLGEFEGEFHKAVNSGQFKTLALDLERHKPGEPDGAPHRFAKLAAERYPQLGIAGYSKQMRIQRTIKAPCEIEAMKEALKVTKTGIAAMMRASRPGMYEYQYKAIFDSTLTNHGVLRPAFPPIISAGKNNFYIHYDSYMGRAEDGDMILNDVGACWDNICNDVSRGWPCNGKFSERQRLLYQCAYDTSEYMFGIIKPGMPMADVDILARKRNFEHLKELNLVDTYENAGKLIWHGGAHHVGYDVHDVVDLSMPISPGMVFCVDIGIYCEEWGIGFRLEDDCLVTEDGCINLSAGIPRTIEEIQSEMSGAFYG